MVQEYRNRSIRGSVEKEEVRLKMEDRITFRGVTGLLLIIRWIVLTCIVNLSTQKNNGNFVVQADNGQAFGLCQTSRGLAITQTQCGPIMWFRNAPNKYPSGNSLADNVYISARTTFLPSFPVANQIKKEEALLRFENISTISDIQQQINPLRADIP